MSDEQAGHSVDNVILTVEGENGVLPVNQTVRCCGRTFALYTNAPPPRGCCKYLCCICGLIPWNSVACVFLEYAVFFSVGTFLIGILIATLIYFTDPKVKSFLEPFAFIQAWLFGILGALFAFWLLIVCVVWLVHILVGWGRRVATSFPSYFTVPRVTPLSV